MITFLEIETCRPSQAQTWPRHTLVHIEMPSITSNKRAPAKRLAAILVTTWGFPWQRCWLLKILHPPELEKNKSAPNQESKHRALQDQKAANSIASSRSKGSPITENRRSPAHPKGKTWQTNPSPTEKPCSLLDANSFVNQADMFAPQASWNCEVKRPRISQVTPVRMMVNLCKSIPLHLLCPLFHIVSVVWREFRTPRVISVALPFMLRLPSCVSHNGYYSQQ